MKKFLISLLMVVVLLTAITFTVSAADDLPIGMTPGTAFEVRPNSADSFMFEGFEFYNQDVWLKVTLTQRGVLNFNCTKLANSAGKMDYTYFYVYKNIDVAAAIKNNKDVDTNVAIWDDYYYKYESVPGNYNFNIPLAKGTYYICIDSGVSYGEFREMSWKLKFTASTAYEVEPNNGANTATAMTLNKAITGYTDTSEDYYTLSLTKNTPIRLYITGYEQLKSKVSIYITLPDGTKTYVSSYDIGKNSSGYYYDILLKKGVNVINVTTCTPAIKYSLKPSTAISYAAPSITDVKKTSYSSYFDASIKWKEITGIDGYEVQQKTGKGAWKSVYDASEYSTGVNLYSFKHSNAYQFRVRAYKEFGSTKYYGAWSKIIYIIPTPTNIKLSATSYVYNGQAKTPTLTIKDVYGTTLKKGTDYTVSYASGRKNVGSYKITITFKGKYSGKATKSFTIKPAAITLKTLKAGAASFTAAWAPKTTQVTGYEIQYSTSKSFSGAKKVTMGSNKTKTKTVKSLKKGKKYYVRIRTYKSVNGVKFYSAWSAAKTVTAK